jgi:hypothetical protein
VAISTFIYLGGSAGLACVGTTVWRVCLIRAWRRNAQEYLALCRDAADDRAEVLSHVERVLQPPPLVPMILRRAYAVDHMLDRTDETRQGT